MTEGAKKASNGVVGMIIALAAAFGGGVVGASFRAGTESQAVADNTVKIASIETRYNAKLETLTAEDTAQKKDIAALQAQLATLAPLMKEIADQHRQMLGELSEIRGEVTVILKQMPVSTLKMEPKNITRKH